MTALADAIKKMVAGPDLSKNIAVAELQAAMAEFSLGEAVPVQAKSFAIEPADLGLSQTKLGVLAVKNVVFSPAETLDSGLKALGAKSGPCFR